MSSTFISQIVPVTQVAVAAASFTNAYTLGGSFASPLIWMDIVSTLDQPVQISFDGTNDHIAVPAGSTVPVYIPIPFRANNAFFASVKIFVKEIGNPTTGSLYVNGLSATIM